MDFKNFIKKSTYKEFVAARKAGAEKIASSSREKGGASTLTQWHFAVKPPLYKADKSPEDLKREFISLKSRLNLNLSQKEFQELMGKLEVLGELYIQRTDKCYSSDS